MAFLRNATFEKGQDGWIPINYVNLVTSQIVRDGTARSGSAFLRVRVDQAGGSIGHDFRIAEFQQYPDSFEFAATRSIGAFAYLRAAPGSPSISGALKLWSLGFEDKPVNDNATNFTVGTEWTMLMCALDGTDYQYLKQYNVYAHPTIRIEFYVDTPNAFLDIDTVIVC